MTIEQNDTESLVIESKFNNEIIEDTYLKHILTSSEPCKSRKITVAALKSLVDGYRPTPSNVYGPGPLLLSDIPISCSSDHNNDGVILGIDEAGRGPVLGPMTYGAAFWNPKDESSIPKGFKDSKVLTANDRSTLFELIKSTPNIGFALRVLHASEISRNMLRKDPYNLNAMSHDAAIQMIRSVIDAGVKINTCYIDTVGMPDAYRRKLEREFDGLGIKFVVEKKADAKYAPCSAASVVAKVSRDSMIETWKWSEPNFVSHDGINFGSGYPSDPKCKSWMEKNLADPVFCFPDLVRFSWAPSKTAIDNSGVIVKWEENNGSDDDHDNMQQTSMSSFIIVQTPSNKEDASKHNQKVLVKKRKRLNHFDRMSSKAVTSIVKL